MKNVLLLDCTYEPIKVISWEDAMFMVVTGDAEVLKERDEPCRSQRQEWKMPSVIRQHEKFKRGLDVNYNRTNIYMRDDWTCQYCNKKKSERELNLDHVIPKCRGGQSTWKNIVTSCRKCNDKKADKSVAEAKMKLLKQPEKPKWLPQQMVLNITNVPKEWEEYVDMESYRYWKGLLEE